MKKILSLLATITVASGATSGALLIVQNNNLQINNLPIGTKKINLDDVLIKSNLGILENDNSQEILKLAQFNNPELNIHEVQVEKINQTLAIITPLKESKVYEQNLIGVQVTFMVKEKEWLKNLIAQTNIGEIVDTTSTTILNRLKKSNPNLNLEYINVRLNTITDQTAIIQSNLNGGYRGEVLLHYTVAAKKISQDLPNPNLGFLSNNDESTVLNALVENNPNLVMSEIALRDITLSSVKLVVNETSTVYMPNDEALVNFTTSPNSLRDDLTVTNLGQLRNNSLEEITKVLKVKTAVKIAEIRIFDIIGFSFKIQAQDNSHYYRVEKPLFVNFTLPKKIDLSDIKNNENDPLNLINFRTKKELIEQIKSKIGSSIIEDGRDFTIEGLKFDSNKNLPKPGQLVVKSTVNSEYLMGQYEFELFAPIDLSAYNKDSKEAVSVNDVERTISKNQIIKQIQADFKSKQIDEETSIFLRNLKHLSLEKEYPVSYKGLSYLKQVSFKVEDNNPVFKGQLNWTNIKPPHYNEISLGSLKTTIITAFVDSSSDRDYPHVTPGFVNDDHDPTRAFWNCTPSIEFKSIDYKEMFNFNSAKEFFNHYSINLNYEWAANAWAGSMGWMNEAGKNVGWENITVPFTNSEQTGKRRENSSDKEYSDTGWDHYHGGFTGKTVKAAGGIKVWMEINKENQLSFYGEAGAWFDWKNASTHNHAGFARLRIISLTIVPKN